MVRVVSYKNISIILLLILMFFQSEVIAQQNINSKIVINPIILDLGIIDEDQYTAEVTIQNLGDTCSLSSKVEGKGSNSITIFPDTFKLLKGESKKVKITINNKSLNAGAYDFSIVFSPNIQNDTSNGWIAAKGSTPLRLKFTKPGITIASFNIVDVEKPKIAPFHIIFANFMPDSSDIDTKITIISEKTGHIITEFNKRVSMNPYPNSGFYGTIKIPFDTSEINMGNYIVHVNGITSNGVRLGEKKVFKIGELQGELIFVSVENVRRGQKAIFKTKIKNIGNLDLKSSFNVIVTDKKSNIILNETKNETIDSNNEEFLNIIMGTDKMSLGSYIVEYEIQFGNDISTGILNFKVTPSYKDYMVILVCLLVFILMIMRVKSYLKSRD